MVQHMAEFSDQIPSLADVRRQGADDAGRRLLEALHVEHGDNISAIARASQATRQQVRTYLKRYGIGRFAKKGKVAREAHR